MQVTNRETDCVEKNYGNLYSIVMPIKIDTEMLLHQANKVTNYTSNSYKLFKEIGLKSYDKFLDISNLESFYIIAPKNEINELKIITKDSKIPFKFIEEEFILNPNVFTTLGW